MCSWGIHIVEIVVFVYYCVIANGIIS
uniref:Uncharacterized protein n=1 Tax=Anguilla anguilla TaxID=7936 RepID=A0A0E9SDD4_ANGAN